jgi:hypothetical protein
MASIKISNLNPTGSDLFADSESYLNELKDEELTSIQGGTGVCNPRSSFRCSTFLCWLTRK